jgi:hypothetical protein
MDSLMCRVFEFGLAHKRGCAVRLVIESLASCFNFDIAGNSIVLSKLAKNASKTITRFFFCMINFHFLSLMYKTIHSDFYLKI